MLQGDSYKIGFRIKRNGVPLTENDVSDVEICIGTLKKSFRTGELTYNVDNGIFHWNRKKHSHCFQ